MKNEKIKIFLIIFVFLFIEYLNLYVFKMEKINFKEVYMRKYEETVKKVSEEYGLDWKLVYAILMQESMENEKAVRFEKEFFKRYLDKLDLPMMEKLKRSFSYGLMQIMGQTAREIGFQDDFEYLFNPETNIRWACKYLKKLFDELKSEMLVISAYNCGISKPKQGIIPNPDYVSSVLMKKKILEEG